MLVTKPQIQEVQRKLSRINTQKTAPVKTFKFLKIKDKVFEEARGKNTLPVGSKDKIYLTSPWSSASKQRVE